MPIYVYNRRFQHHDLFIGIHYSMLGGVIISLKVIDKIFWPGARLKPFGMSWYTYWLVIYAKKN